MLNKNRSAVLGVVIPLFVAALASGSALAGDDAALLAPAATNSPELAQPADVLVVDWNQARQTMQGFGASNVFLDIALTDAQADLYFSASTGIGLSLLRMGIRSDGELMGGAWSDATKAAARGAQIWATPWTAPGAWKDNNSNINGGHLCAAAGQGLCTASHYNDWAQRLAAFPGRLSANAGVSLYALSIQNEPDYAAPSYASMLVSDTEFVNFTGVLGPLLAALNPRPRLIVGEYSNWNRLWSLVAALNAAPAAAAYVDTYGTHQYWDVPPFQSVGAKPLWQTEMSSFDAFDPSISNGIKVAKWIYTATTKGNVAAWHYWWLYNPFNPDNEGLIGHSGDRTAPTKRLYALGNYSKFVRPGWVRIEVAGQTSTSVFASAFKHPSNGQFVIVVVNDSAAAVAFSANLTGIAVSTLTPWLTSATVDLQAQPSIVISNNNLGTVVVRGVTTFVGVNDRIFGDGFD